MTVLSKALLASFAAKGDVVAIHTDAASYTYRQLYDETARQYALLHAAGIAPGDTVFLQGDYTFIGIAIFLALYNNGNIIAMNTSTAQTEIDEKIGIAQPRFIMETSTGTLRAHAGQDAVAMPLIDRLREAGHAGLVLFSSGTTGKPKAMLHDLEKLVDGYAEKRPRPLSMLLFLLFDHIGGINTLLNVLATGSNATLVSDKTPQHVAHLIERFRIAILPTSPTFLNLLLITGAFESHDVSSLRMITYGTEPMPEGVLARLRKQLPRVKLLQTFGTSETGIVNTVSAGSDSLYMKFNDATTEHQVVDGELWLRSTRQILGYLNHASDSFTEDGWFKTGDMVDTLENGMLRIRGRTKEIINVGGEKVFPSEVESVLLLHPFVEDCKAYGEVNGVTGQFVVADVVLSSAARGAPAASFQEIRRFARQRMDAYKVPVRLNSVTNIAYSARFKKVLLNQDHKAQPMEQQP